MGLDAASQSAASRPSAHDAVECDPRASGGARHHLGQRPQWYGRAVRGYCEPRKMIAFQRSHGSALKFLLGNTQLSRQRLGSSRSVSMPGTDRVRKARRLEEIPGVGPIVATALVAEVGDWRAFASGRGLGAWIGLRPKATFNRRQKTGGISKQGNRHLRWLRVAGAMAVIRYARQHGTKRPWLARLMATRPIKVAAVALANKIAGMAWAMMVRGERYKEPTLMIAAWETLIK